MYVNKFLVILEQVPHLCFFWVSSLAYPTSLGQVVVVEQLQCLYLDTVVPSHLQYGIFILAVADLGLVFVPVAYI